MEDQKIIELYFARDEGAIQATSEKYGAYCHTIARRILEQEEDAEEDSYEGEEDGFDAFGEDGDAASDGFDEEF